MRQRHDSLHLAHVPPGVGRDFHSFAGAVAGGLAEEVSAVVERWIHAVALGDEAEASGLGQVAHK